MSIFYKVLQESYLNFWVYKSNVSMTNMETLYFLNLIVLGLLQSMLTIAVPLKSPLCHSTA